MKWFQHTIKLAAVTRGFHLITEKIVRECSELSTIDIGLCHIFIQHTSASLIINENTDPSVRTDFESHINIMVPENAPYYVHTYEGADDMPAHIKSSLMGNSVQIPITNGKLNLGIWQGIYLCEHRNNGTGRDIVVTIFGN